MRLSRRCAVRGNRTLDWPSSVPVFPALCVLARFSTMVSRSLSSRRVEELEGGWQRVGPPRAQDSTTELNISQCEMSVLNTL